MSRQATCDGCGQSQPLGASQSRPDGWCSFQRPTLVFNSMPIAPWPLYDLCGSCAADVEGFIKRRKSAVA